MERPKICAVRVMLVSLSNMPCVSMSSTATFSPAAEVRRKGSDHIQIPVVCRSWPPRQAKLSGPASACSFKFPSDRTGPSAVIQVGPRSSGEPWRRKRRKKLSKKDFPVRNAPTTDINVTFALLGTLLSTRFRFSSNRWKESPGSCEDSFGARIVMICKILCVMKEGFSINQDGLARVFQYSLDK